MDASCHVITCCQSVPNQTLCGASLAAASGYSLGQSIAQHVWDTMSQQVCGVQYVSVRAVSPGIQLKQARKAAKCLELHDIAGCPRKHHFSHENIPLGRPRPMSFKLVKKARWQHELLLHFAFNKCEKQAPLARSSQDIPVPLLSPWDTDFLNVSSMTITYYNASPRPLQHSPATRVTLPASPSAWVDWQTGLDIFCMVIVVG